MGCLKGWIVRSFCRQQKRIPASKCLHLTVLRKFNVAFLQRGISNDTRKIKQLKSDILKFHVIYIQNNLSLETEGYKMFFDQHWIDLNILNMFNGV